MVPEFLSLVRGGEVDMREIESIHRVFAENLADVNLRDKLNQEIDTVTNEVTCIVETRCRISSRDEEESFRNANEIKWKSNVFVCPARVSAKPW